MIGIIFTYLSKDAYSLEVFVYGCVSTFFRLNGRKVTRKNLRIAEKIKI